MKFKFKHLLLLTICCFNSLLVAHANEKLWNDAKQNLAAPKYNAVMPEKFRTLQLDFNGINSLLAKAPIQDVNIFAKSSQQKISLPLPYGGFEHFYVVQTITLKTATFLLETTQIGEIIRTILEDMHLPLFRAIPKLSEEELYEDMLHDFSQM